MKRYALALLSGVAIGLMAVATTTVTRKLPDDDMLAIVRGTVVEHAMQQLDYDIASVRSGEAAVPHVFLASLPADLDQVPVPSVRKDMFVTMVLPLVLRANAEIAAERERLLEIKAHADAGQNLGPDERLWLSMISERYDTTDMAALVRRVDVVPPSLALAQAAEESGWGTSRFAVAGNALFGQRGDGLLARGDDDTKVRSYSNLSDAVRSYALNLNTHRAYKTFRDARAAARAKGEAIDGYHLAQTLGRYSELGANYVQNLRRIMRMNRFTELDKARLGDSPST